jgi:hypothetical protein
MIRSAAALLTESLDEALTEVEVVLSQRPRWVVGITLRAAILAALGRKDEARALEAEVTEIWPGFTLETVARTFPFKDPTFNDKLRELLRVAGWQLAS